MKCLLFLVLIPIGAVSQKALPDIRLTNVMDGSKVALSAYPACDGLVLVFTSNECPFDHYYTARIKALSEIYQGKIQFLMINSSPEPAEAEDQMKSYWSRTGVHLPYLSDKDQVAYTLLQPAKSPEVFLVKNNGTNWTVVYRGAIDDSPQVATDVNTQFLRDAIEQLVSQKPVSPTQTRPVGCSIKKK
jgi:hypothetical protein